MVPETAEDAAPHIFEPLEDNTIMKRLLQTIRWPLMIEIVNSILIQVLENSTVFLVLSWAITITIIFWGGWLVIKEQWGTLLHAASIGPILIILGVTLIGGIYNLATGDFSHVVTTVKTDINPRLLYFGGVVVSTLASVPIAALISLFGGVLGRKHSDKLRTKTI